MQHEGRSGVPADWMKFTHKMVGGVCVSASDLRRVRRWSANLTDASKRISVHAPSAIPLQFLVLRSKHVKTHKSSLMMS